MNFLKGTSYKSSLTLIVVVQLISLGFSACKQGMSTKYTDRKLAEAAKIKEDNKKISNLPCETPWGEAIEPGQVIKAYKAATACEVSCESLAMERQCVNGGLTGSDEYQFKDCLADVCRSCKLPWGGLIVHGKEVTSFKSGSIPCGGSCETADNTQTRKCVDGVLGGSEEFNLGSCEIAKCSCEFPWNSAEKIPDAGAIQAFRTNEVACDESCNDQSLTITCNAGTFQTGTPTRSIASNDLPLFGSCKTKQCLSCQWNGKDVPHNGKVFGYKSAVVGSSPGETCEATELKCKNGVVVGSGDAPHPECRKKCALNWVDAKGVAQREEFNPGEVKSLFKVNQVGCKESNEIHKVQVVCENSGTGKLLSTDGSALPTQLYGDAPAICTDCKLNETVVPEGDVTPEYFDVGAATCTETCDSHKTAFRCVAGKFILTKTGLEATPGDLLSYSKTSCTPKDCSCANPLAGLPRMAHGEPVTTFNVESVGCDLDCGAASIVRTCLDSVLVGPVPGADYSTYDKSTCFVQPCGTCTWNGATIPHKGKVTGFKEEVVGPDPQNSCESAELTCRNGVILGAGNYPSFTCKKKCKLDWKDHEGKIRRTEFNPGETKTVYRVNQVACGESNESKKLELRCDDSATGTLFLSSGAAATPAELSTLAAEAPEICVDCKLSDETVVKDGATTQDFYDSTSASCTQSCNERKTAFRCVAGKLIKTSNGSEATPLDLASFTKTSCVPKDCSCASPFGSGPRLNHGDQIKSFRAQTVACEMSCDSVAVVRTCEDKVLKGPIAGETYPDFINPSCTVSACQGCTWNQINFAHRTSTTGFRKNLAQPNEECESAEIFCRDGQMIGGGDFPAKTCSKMCGLGSLILAPGGKGTLYSKSTAECSENISDFKVEVTCDVAGSGRLQLAGGGDLPGTLFDKIEQKCVDCDFRGTKVKDGSRTEAFYSAQTGTCTQSCESQRTSFYCSAGVLKKEDGSIAADAANYQFTSCNQGCVQCDLGLKEGKITLQKGGTKTLSSKGMIVGCEESCDEVQATVRCEEDEATGLGQLKIISAKNTALKISDLKYGSCEKAAGLRCSSGGNPPRACSMPGEMWTFGLGVGKGYYQPWVDRPSWLDPVLSRIPSGDWIYLSYLIQFTPGEASNPLKSASINSTPTNYGKHPIFGNAQSWLYQVSPDSRMTFYDTPEVDQEISPGDDCDRHAMEKTCDPDGYWLVPGAKFGQRGGVGPTVETPESSRYRYATCATRNQGEPVWSSRKILGASCVDGSTSGGCLFPKNPFRANNYNRTDELASLDHLQTLRIQWASDATRSGILADDSFRVTESIPKFQNVCELYQEPFTTAEISQFNSALNRDKSAVCTSIKAAAAARGKKYIGEVLFTTLSNVTELPQRVGVSNPQPASISQSGEKTVEYKTSGKLPVSSYVYLRKEGGQYVVPMTSNVDMTSRDYPALRMQTFYQLKDFSETLSERIGKPWVYFKHRRMEVLLGAGSPNNAFFADVSASDPTLSNSDILGFGPKRDTVAQSGTVAGWSLKFGPPLSLDGSITAHELGHASLFYANRKSLPYVEDQSLNCKTAAGCFTAIHEGQADFFAMMLYPESPAIGDWFAQDARGISSCGIYRNPELNANLTAAAAFSACGPGYEGEPHTLGNVYASVWWELRKAQSGEDGKRSIERLFLEHQKYITTGMTFLDTYDAVRVAEARLYGKSEMRYSSSFRAELNRRLSVTVPSTRVPASSAPVLSELSDIVLARSGAGTSVQIEITGPVDDFQVLSGNTQVLPSSAISVRTGIGDDTKSTGYTQRIVSIGTPNAAGECTITVKASYFGATTSKTFKVTVLASDAPSGVDQAKTYSLDLKLGALNGFPLSGLYEGTTQILGFSGSGFFKGSPPVYYPEIGYVGPVTFWVQVTPPSGPAYVTEITLNVGGITEINTVADLSLMQENLFGSFKLMHDLDLSEVMVPIIGTKTKPFYGVFDGNSHTLTNLTIHGQSPDMVAWFPGLKGQILNLKVKNLEVFGDAPAVGGLVGRTYPYSLISYVDVEGTVAGGWRTGGIAISVGGKIKRSSFSGSIRSLAIRSGDQITFPVRDAVDLQIAGLIGDASVENPISLSGNPVLDQAGNALPYSNTVMDVESRSHLEGVYLSGAAKVQVLSVPTKSSARIPATVVTPADPNDVPVGAILEDKVTPGNFVYPFRSPAATLSASGLYCGTASCSSVDYVHFVQTDKVCRESFQFSGVNQVAEVTNSVGFALMTLPSGKNPQVYSAAIPKVSKWGGAAASLENLGESVTKPLYSGIDNTAPIKNVKIKMNAYATSPVSHCGSNSILGTVVAWIPPRLSETDVSTIACTIKFSGISSLQKVQGCSPSGAASSFEVQHCADNGSSVFVDGTLDSDPIPNSVPPAINASTLPISATISGIDLVLIGGSTRPTGEALTTQFLLKASGNKYFHFAAGTSGPGGVPSISGLPPGVSATISCP